MTQSANRVLSELTKRFRSEKLVVSTMIPDSAIAIYNMDDVKCTKELLIISC